MISSLGDIVDTVGENCNSSRYWYFSNNKGIFESLGGAGAIALLVLLWLLWVRLLKIQPISGIGLDAGAFANGGVVGGSSFSGDRLFARVNSGEMILNTRQQGNLLGMLQPSGSAPMDLNIEVQGRIKGEDLALSASRVSKRKNRVG